MDVSRYLQIGKIASPPFLLAGAGGLAGFIFEETVVDMIHKKRWVLPVMCTLCGFAAGAFISIKQL
jgi:hypothetical protein